MRSRRHGSLTIAALALAAASLLAPGSASAHCDGLDGPVVAAGQTALETGDVRHALIWVLEPDEEEVRHAFDHALRVRALGGEARVLADRFFFETLVRVHRAGEGEPYTGLKPAGRDLGAAIPAADRALESGSSAELEAVLMAELRRGLHARFERARGARDHAPTDVQAGRGFVASYVPFLHYVEGVFQAAGGTGAGHEDPAHAAHPRH